MEDNKEEILTDRNEIYLNGVPEGVAQEVPDVIGGHGPWQFRHWMVFFVASLCHCMHLFSVIFAISQIQCYGHNATGSEVNESLLQSSTTNESFPLISMVDCYTYPCEEATVDLPDLSSYHPAQGRTSCSTPWIVTYSKCIYVLGCVLSGLLIRILYLKFGRRPVCLTSCVLFVACSVATSWAKSSAVFLVLRFVATFAIVNVYLVSAYALMGCVQQEYKVLYGLTGHLGWGIGHFVLPIVSWLADDWASFHLFLGPAYFLLFLLACFLPEAPESFAARGQWSRTRRALKVAAFSNGFPTRDVDLFTHSLILRQEQEVLHGVSAVLNWQAVFRYCLLFSCSFTTTFLYLASKWLTNRFQLDGGIYFALMGSTEVSATILLLFLTCFLPVHYLWAIASVLASTLMLIMYSKADDGSPLPTIPYMGIMCFSSAAWALLLFRNVWQPCSSRSMKLSAVVSATALCLGAFAASAIDLQKFQEWGHKPLLIWGVPHLIIGAFTFFLLDSNSTRKT